MNELIERYVAAALEPVPEKQRAEVRAEIQGAISEMVDQRIEAGEPEDAAVRAALTELGDPASLAKSYSDGQQYLIGPGWYPTYIKALKVVSSVVLPIVAVVTMLETLGEDGGGMTDAIGGAVESVIWAAAMVLLWTTVGFVIAERVEGPRGLGQRDRTWSVGDLPAAMGPRQITLKDVAPSLIALVAFGALAILQSSRDVGFFVRGDFADSYDHLPAINPDLGAGWAIGFFALLALSMVVEVVKYMVGSWTRPVVLAVAAEAVLWIAYVGILARSEAIFNPELAQRIEDVDADWWVAGGTANSIAAVIVIAVSLWDIWEAWQGHRKYRLMGYTPVVRNQGSA
jgi:uncharacterized membrane protein (Fun14 family)